MREILFRGKTPDGQWICGTGWTEFLNMFPERTGKVWLWSDHQWKEIIPETIGQYTGLKDKNGEMIFEGDLIRTTNNGFNISKQEMRGIVEYVNCGFVGNRKNMAQDISLRSSDLEIIGNIHDNPELLK